VNDLQVKFNSTDVNGSGVLDSDQIKDLLQRTTTSGMSDESLDTFVILQLADTKSKSSMDFSEFLLVYSVLK